jgi:hypothetical protein
VRIANNARAAAAKTDKPASMKAKPARIKTRPKRAARKRRL